MADIDFAVIIPHYNDNLRLLRCVEALDRQAIQSSRYAIVVVDNGSDQVPDQKEFGSVELTILHEQRTGSYMARNCGIEHINAKYYAFTDSDCMPGRHWLEAAQAALCSEEVDAVTGPISLFPQNVDNISATELLELLFAFPQRNYVEKNNYAPTANLVVRKDAFDKVGVFDGSLLSGGDAEWGKRLAGSGGRLAFMEDVAIDHPARRHAHEYLSKIRRTTHGLWQQRSTNDDVKALLTPSGIISLLLPPVTRAVTIYNSELKATLSVRVWAMVLLYVGKLYRLQQFIACALGLVKTYQRK